MGGPAAESPVLRQFLEAKAGHPGSVLVFRLGDFFETFQEDAEVASRVCGLTLTSRDFGRAGRFPMAGFPAHAAEGYLGKLLKAGHTVAVCDQVEAAGEGKKLLRREVVRVLTPGTVLEGQLLDPTRANHLAAMAEADGCVGLAVFEVTTGRIDLLEMEPGETGALPELLAGIAPAEVLLADGGDEGEADAFPALRGGGWRLARLEPWRFSSERGRQRLMHVLGVESLRGFDCEDMGAALGAAGAALDYLHQNRVELPPEVIRVRRLRLGSAMHLDPPTLANLEVTDSLGGPGRGLLGLVDRTRTAMGARSLRAWLIAPLTDVEAIRRRLDAVETLSAGAEPGATLAAGLGRVRDLERLVTRTAQGRAAPRDLGAIRDSLPPLEDLAGALRAAAALELVAAGEAITGEENLRALLDSALEADLPAAPGEGPCVRPGYDAQLDELRGGIRDAQDWIGGLEAAERAATGIRSLRVGFNRVFGYYIEVSHANHEAVPAHYVRRQTLAGAERYVTPELKQRESTVLGGEAAIVAREREVLAALSAAVAARAPSLLASAEAVGRVDALQSVAEVARELGWVKPEVDYGYAIEVEGGRHPLVEASRGTGRFVPNDTSLHRDSRLMLLTGPNMAGKSTYLRQVGLLVLLAQVGSFVPAGSARVGVVDRIFTRVGAHDAIAQGLSTFMVEMVETANILSNATPRSLVIVDEIGRGTSTYDGMSIAQAVVEELHDSPRLGCKTIFATHFHELTALETRLDALRNHRMEVSEEGGRVTFLHRVVPGGADRSYGIHVAEIAGLPRHVTARAREILDELEQARPLGAASTSPGQLALPLVETDAVKRALRGLEIETLSPLEALNRLAELKALSAETPTR